MQLSGHLALFTVSVPGWLRLQPTASPWVLFSRVGTQSVTPWLCGALGCPAQWPNPMLVLAKPHRVSGGLNLLCLPG